jgi:hypothetical protein
LLALSLPLTPVMADKDERSTNFQASPSNSTLPYPFASAEKADAKVDEIPENRLLGFLSRPTRRRLLLPALSLPSLSPSVSLAYLGDLQPFVAAPGDQVPLVHSSSIQSCLSNRL